MELQQVFNQIQTCTPRIYSENISKAVDLIVVDTSFLTILHTIFACRKNTVPPRVALFLKRVFEELQSSRLDVLEGILRYTLPFTSCKNIKFRRHVLKIIHMILVIKRFDLPIDILQCLSERLFDKDSGVRKEALKIWLLFQDENLNDTLKIHGVLKDVLRYDQIYEIRKMALLEITISPSTINCVIERCVDMNIHVRKIFWIACFPKLFLKDLPDYQRIYLMKSAAVEREFDAKSIFIQYISHLGIEEFAENFYCTEPAFDEFIEALLINGDYDFTLTKFTRSYIYLLNIFYKFKEDKYGRDCLLLMSLVEFLDIIYYRSMDLEAQIKEYNPDGIEFQNGTDQFADEIKNDISVITGMFKIFSFYDIFTEETRKSILKIINLLLTKCIVREIVEEAIILCKRICPQNLTGFLGSIIKNTKGTRLCFALCECIMKHLLFSDMHEAIFQEIALTNLSQSADV